MKYNDSGNLRPEILSKMQEGLSLSQLIASPEITSRFVYSMSMMSVTYG